MTPQPKNGPVLPGDKISWIASTVKVKRGYWLTLADGERVFCWNKGVSYACDFGYGVDRHVKFAVRPGDDRVFILGEKSK